MSDNKKKLSKELRIEIDNLIERAAEQRNLWSDEELQRRIDRIRNLQYLQTKLADFIFENMSREEVDAFVNPPYLRWLR